MTICHKNLDAPHAAGDGPAVGPGNTGRTWRERGMPPVFARADIGSMIGAENAETRRPGTASPVAPDPATLSDTELDRLRRRLEQEERTVSRRRAVMHDRIDFVHGGGGGSGHAVTSQLAELQRRENEITEQRRVLHEQIDALRAEASRRRNQNAG